MQEQNVLAPFHHALVSKGRWAALALSMLLVGCQAAAPGHSETVESDTAPAHTSPSTPPAPTAAEAPIAAETTTGADASDDEYQSPRPPDDSYRKANLRPEFGRCIKASGGTTPDMYACGDDELAFHEQRLEAQFSRIIALPDGSEKDRLMDEQAAYMSDTDRYCAYNPPEDGQGQMLDAQSCRIHRTANRADALQALNLK